MLKIYPLLLEKINSKQAQIEQWFEAQFAGSQPVFYNSVDLRHSSFKIAPIDTNCFPAGFNNLSAESRKSAVPIAKKFLETHFPQSQKILIIPESHTRNFRYLENVLALQSIISESGKEVILGSLIEEIQNQMVIDLENGSQITLHKIILRDDKIYTVSGFVPDLIISNNDFTIAPQEMIQNATQPIIPPLYLGWHLRTKSHHFDIYNQLAAELAQLLDIDPWLISTLHSECENVDFKEMLGLQELAAKTDELLGKIKNKYEQYGITDEPYCYIKADNGTYGIAMMTVKSGAELMAINKKERNKMNMLKGNVRNSKVIVQEGIATIDKIHDIIAEPMIYLLGGQVVGNLFRSNKERDANISLNAAGMVFDDLTNLRDEEILLGLNKDEITKIYAVIARLAALAASRERY